jgi:hypothetical protein
MKQKLMDIIYPWGRIRRLSIALYHAIEENERLSKQLSQERSATAVKKAAPAKRKKLSSGAAYKA